ncbi:MAG: hypothetical protein JWO82_626 [Akkermansiaceae bacterium]|nr:hypothetical protein [Akkermansiaceae bacterium]
MTISMSSDDVHKLATSDTPSAVSVPPTMMGLVTWAVGRFGGAALIAIAAVYFLTKVYTDMRVQGEQQLGDMKAQNAAMLEVIRSQTSASERVASALQELAKQVEKSTAK